MRTLAVRIAVALVSQSVLLFAGSSGTADDLAQVVDLSGQGIELDLGISDQTDAGVGADGAIILTNPPSASPELRGVYRFDPATGAAAQLATVDLSTVAGEFPQSVSAFAPDGTVYFIVTDGMLTPQQDVYRLDGETLTPVIDLTAQGVELQFTSGGISAIGTSSGGLQVTDADPSDPAVHRVYGLNPAGGTAQLLATVDLADAVGGMYARGVSALGTNGEVYFIAGNGDYPEQQSVLRLDGETLTPLIDLTDQGLEVDLMSYPGLTTAVTASGAIVVAQPGMASYGLHSVLRLDPAAGTATLLGTVDARDVVGEFAMPQDVPVIGLGGEPYFVVSDGNLPPAQGVYRFTWNHEFTQVLDLAEQGVELHSSPYGEELATGVDLDGVIRVVSAHPSIFDLWRVYRIDPLTEIAAVQAVVDLGLVAEMPESNAVLGPYGAVYFFVSDTQLQPWQQAVYGLDAGVLTKVIDLTSQGVELNFMSLPSSGVPAAVALDGTIIVADVDEFYSQIRHVYRLDPATGSAPLPATVDLSVVAGEFAQGVPAFALDGTVYFIVSDGEWPPQQSVHRLDGGTLTQVIDLTAQGVEFDFMATASPFRVGAALDGSILVVDQDNLYYDIRRVYRLDPAAGTAERLARVDLGVTPSEGGMGMSTTAFAPHGLVYFVVSDAGIPPQSRLYRLPEPSRFLLCLAALAVLAGLARRGLSASQKREL